MANSYLDAAIVITDVKITYSALSQNYYKPKTNEIFLNSLNDTFGGKLIKAATARPSWKNFSLAHEVGHAVCELLDLYGSEDFTNLFGAQEEYNGGYDSMLKSVFTGGDEHTATKYGTTDPEEDFADTFAILVCCKNKIPSKINGKKVKGLLRDKFEYVQDILEQIHEKALSET